MVCFKTFLANDIVTKHLPGYFIGPDNIQVFIHHAHVIANRPQYGIKSFLAFSQRFVCPFVFFLQFHVMQGKGDIISNLFE